MSFWLLPKTNILPSESITQGKYIHNYLSLEESNENENNSKTKEFALFWYKTRDKLKIKIKKYRWTMNCLKIKDK